MTRENNDKWLDELLKRNINSSDIQFDAEKWKQKFPDEFQQLKSRANITAEQKVRISKSLLIKIAAAAVIIVVIGLFLIQPRPGDNSNVKVDEPIKSPGELLTSTALLNAYLDGGIEAVDEQNRKAVQMLNRKPVEITIHELLKEIDSI